jgi:hypothetical protein
MAENGFSKTGWIRHMIEIPWGRAAGTGTQEAIPKEASILGEGPGW